MFGLLITSRPPTISCHIEYASMSTYSYLLILAFSIWLHNLMCSTFSLHTLYLLQKILRKSLLLVLRIPSRLVWYCICDPLGEKGTVREIIQIGGKRPRTCNIDFLSFSYVKFSLFSSFWYAIYIFYTKISMFNNKKKSNSQLPCTRIRTRSSKIGNWLGSWTSSERTQTSSRPTASANLSWSKSSSTITRLKVSYSPTYCPTQQLATHWYEYSYIHKNTDNNDDKQADEEPEDRDIEDTSQTADDRLQITGQWLGIF